ncbi:uncharacterized protein PFL1_05769 [Pseudozyma flocculosa PF-1]|uniref:hydroxymethylglutaryl-CoA lyase n=1 Tax=Pseudozyma flocculosa PF-1 TaxID=1277687 RepID=A0A061H859_9BASI|nr:uncharacterized protein PFL1_05769 [Pseudozyma flocculosa PF-1]EPQ26791.1 hypothetical protein PFL1_05769 [Pseudozyma flocculosa PF-1]
MLSRPSTAGSASSDRFVKIVEVSPRDGLQNEKQVVPTEIKLELIRRLGQTGLRVIEAGAFVSPKWVPQMGDTPSLLRSLPLPPSSSSSASAMSYPVLVPNAKGLDSLQELLRSVPQGQAAPTDEIAIFTAASQSFCKANTNCTIKESLDRLSQVTSRALQSGLKVRGYVSTVAGCPYEGDIDPEKVGEVSKALLDMGCYEVSLGDTIGVGTPTKMEAVLEASMRKSGRGADVFAAHCHDTFSTGLANVLHLVGLGVRTVDSSVGGLGGCPYSPGATGNIDTESVVFALEKEGYRTGADLERLAEIGEWITAQIGRETNASNTGRAIMAKRRLKAKKEAEAQTKAKL